MRFQLKVSQSGCFPAQLQELWTVCVIYLHLTDLGQGLWERREDVNSELLPVLWSKPCWVAQGSASGIQPQVLVIGSGSSCQASGYLKMGEWAPKGIGLPQQQRLSWAVVVICANLQCPPQGLVLDQSYQVDILLTLLGEARRHNLPARLLPGRWFHSICFFCLLE